MRATHYNKTAHHLGAFPKLSPQAAFFGFLFPLALNLGPEPVSLESFSFSSTSIASAEAEGATLASFLVEGAGG